MTPERWEQVKTVVADALEIEQHQRATFIAQACNGDIELRREVESMLAQSADRLEIAADRLHAPAGSNGTPAGARLGAYAIVREIGRGGMGAVYLARRADEEFHKEVAVKLLKRGTDTDEVLRRFRAERQILARLEHPNIARLLDGGTTEDGLPYFVMEHVSGVPITEFCRQRALDVRQRIELFLRVCGAVHFAHQNLVVHRDLKPRNIMVTAEGEPKLLDFGIAKLLAPEDGLAQTTLADHQRLTPGYASPEQVRGEPATTASDVYSLGALLYELLAETPPHRFETAHPSPAELFRVIVEREPPRASSVATDPEARRELRSDLDNILETALRKERERRYSGVTAFADDLRRYLEGRPVRARPATIGYRASKFVSRNKLGVAAATLLVLSLIGGIAATMWQARKAERRFQQVRKLAHAVVFDYHDLVVPLRGSTPVRERLVRDALEYLDNLAQEAANDHELLRELATAYDKIGRVQGNSYFANLGDADGALKSYRKSLEIRRRLLASQPENPDLQEETASSHEGIGDVLYGNDDLRGGLESYERAIELRERALPSRRGNITPHLYLAQVYARAGDIKGFEHYANLGDTAGGVAAFRRAVDLLEPLYPAHADNPDMASQFANVLTHAGMLYCTSGDVAGALALERRAVAIIEQLAASKPDTQIYAAQVLAAKHWLRFALEDNDELAEAIGLSRDVMAKLQTLLADDPKNTQLRKNLGITYNMLGKDLLLTGDVAGALASHQAALAITEQLAGETSSAEIKADLAVSLWRLGRAQAAAGQHEAAIENYRKALGLRQPVVEADATNARARDDIGSILADLGNAFGATQQFGPAMDAFGRAVALAEELSAQAPTNARLRARLALRYAEAGRLHVQMAKAEAGGTLSRERARDSLNRSLEIWQELRETGKLIPSDAAKPDEARRELAACEAPL